MVDKITYNDLKEYDFLFTMTPSFLMGTVIKRNTNVVKKFNSTVKSNLDNLNEKQKKQLNIIINTDMLSYLAAEVWERRELMKRFLNLCATIPRRMRRSNIFMQPVR